MKRLARVRSVTPLAGFVVHLEFTDGTAKDVDLDSSKPAVDSVA